MEIPKALQLMHETAEEIRNEVATRVQAWQALPYWTLESEGRGGWDSNHSLPYTNGLFGVSSSWPHRVFVECATGILVVNGGANVEKASDEDVITAYASSPERFDVVKQLAYCIDLATNGKDTWDKETNDRRREEFRDEYKVPFVWTEPAKPIKYSYIN
jgi:hypothetical protein